MDRVEALLCKALELGIQRRRDDPTTILALRTLAWGNASTDSRLEEDLLATLHAEPELLQFDGVMFCTGAGASLVDLQRLSKWLLIRTLDKGPRQAVFDLNRYLDLDHNPGYHVLAISGLEVTRPVKLGNGLSLIPFDSLPKSFVTRVLAPENAFLPHPFPIPRAALVKRSPTKPKTRKQDETPTISHPSVEAQLYEACLWLTLVGPSSPLPVAAWWQLDSWVPFVSQIGSSWSSTQGDVAHGNVRVLSEQDEREARRVMQVAMSAPRKRAERLRIPLERLNQALRRQHIADRAIDLGIALESLLFDDRQQSEIAFQFRLRGAWLMGESVGDKRTVMELLNEVYDCRSRASHSGMLIKQKRSREPKMILEEGVGLAARIIFKVASDGSPDWRSLVLGN